MMIYVLVYMESFKRVKRIIISRINRYMTSTVDGDQVSTTKNGIEMDNTG
jgi:hypothetical protein